MARETDWSQADLETISGSAELNIAPLRADGAPEGTLPIWVVRVGDGIYVRSWHGPSGHWYRGVQVSQRARVNVGNFEAQVEAQRVDDEAINDAIDSAYREKYGRSSYVSEMVRPEARATTLRLHPLASADTPHPQS